LATETSKGCENRVARRRLVKARSSGAMAGTSDGESAGMTTSESSSAVPIARLSGVSLRYRQTVALNNVDLDIPTARVVGVIGPDGVGKSSLLSLIAGARAVQQGRVEALGGDMA